MRFFALVFVLLNSAIAFPASAQMREPGLNGRSGGHAVYGDVKVEEDPADRGRTVKLDLTLYTESRTIVARDTVSNNGRYRFNNIPSGIYDLVVESEGREVARFRVDLTSPLVDERKQDLEFSLMPGSAGARKADPISAADFYQRNSKNEALFVKANSSIDDKHYDEGVDLLQKLVATDPKDFQAWTVLANVHLVQSKFTESENEYLRAIDLHANFFPALINLGRLEAGQQKYDVAIEILNRAIKSRPESAEANRLLGECYLQIKKGSLAVTYLNEALRLEPQKMVEVRLRLALLYNAAGMKDKAATEYEQFLKAKPDYPDRKKLEKYIADNKKP